MSRTVEPIVLVAPAMAIGSRYYRPVVEAFRARGWDARALPRRGYERDRPPASRSNDWSYQDEIDDIAEVIAECRRDIADRPVIVLGHSLGGQLAVGNQLNGPPADGLAMIGACLPDHRYYPMSGPHIAVMAAVVPAVSAVRGFVPKPFFGGPGARTLMRQWGRIALTGALPFATPGLITTPTLVVQLDGDRLAPPRAVDHFAERFFDPAALTRWTYRDPPAGASTDHILWVRTPQAVADRVVQWWADGVRMTP